MAERRRGLFERILKGGENLDFALDKVVNLLPPSAAARMMEGFTVGDRLGAFVESLDLVPVGKVAKPLLATFLPAGLLKLPIGQATDARAAGIDISPGSDFHRQTGMFEDPLGNILTEVTDHRARLVGQPGKEGLFSELLDHPDLYRQLPEAEAVALANTPVVPFTEQFRKAHSGLTGGLAGAFQPLGGIGPTSKGRIFLDPTQTGPGLFENAAHEGLGHRIQQITGLPGGTDPSEILPHIQELDGFFSLLESGVSRETANQMAARAAYNLYRDSIGEVGAFDLANRLKATAAERFGTDLPFQELPRVGFFSGKIPPHDLMVQALENQRLESLNRGLFGSR